MRLDQDRCSTSIFSKSSRAWQVAREVQQHSINVISHQNPPTHPEPPGRRILKNGHLKTIQHEPETLSQASNTRPRYRSWMILVESPSHLKLHNSTNFRGVEKQLSFLSPGWPSRCWFSKSVSCGLIHMLLGQISCFAIESSDI